MDVAIPGAGFVLTMLSTVTGVMAITSGLVTLLIGILLLDDLGREWPSPGPRPRERGSRARVDFRPQHVHGERLLLAVGLAGMLAVGGPRHTLAQFTDAEASQGSLSTAASFPVTYYLHNNPTPPVGNTNQQANLPMDGSVPTATTLYNYDADRDSFAGRYVLWGGIGALEVDLTKYQDWRTAVLGSSTTIGGTVTLDFWSAIKDFGNAKQGSVEVFLRDFDPGLGMQPRSQARR